MTKKQKTTHTTIIMVINNAPWKKSYREIIQKGRKEDFWHRGG